MVQLSQLFKRKKESHAVEVIYKVLKLNKKGEEGVSKFQQQMNSRVGPDYKSNLKDSSLGKPGKSNKEYESFDQNCYSSLNRRE